MGKLILVFDNPHPIGLNCYVMKHHSRIMAMMAGFLSWASLPAASAPSAAFVESSNDFACDCYRLMIEELGAGANLCFSPLSISQAFAMVYPGAKGNTAAQLAASFHFQADPAVLAVQYADLNAWLEEKKVASGAELNFSLANGVWLQNGFPFHQDYLDLVTNPFQARLELADFEARPEEERAIVNQWVLDRTGGRIKDLLPGGVIDGSTCFVLVNALYFKGAWATGFNPQATYLGRFIREDGQFAYVPTMWSEVRCRTYEDEAVLALECDFENSYFSMLFLVPAAGQSLSELGQTLTGSRLADWCSKLDSDYCYLHLPRFSIDSDFDLIKILPRLGVTDLFLAEKADLSGMTPRASGLSVTAAVHKANCTVNERGVEAAAATGIVGGYGSVPPTRRIDRAFLYAIREKASGTILFLGRVDWPNTSQGEAERMNLVADAMRRSFTGEIDSLWLKQSTFGDLYFGAFPWLFTGDLGWFYYGGTVSDEEWYFPLSGGVWFWRQASDWHYTRANDWYPFSWSIEQGWFWKGQPIQ